MTPKKQNNRSNENNEAKNDISRTTKNIPDVHVVVPIEKSALHPKKKWNFAKITLYLNLQNKDELQKAFL